MWCRQRTADVIGDADAEVLAALQVRIFERQRDGNAEGILADLEQQARIFGPKIGLVGC
jgi:hypothetical protein